MYLLIAQNKPLKKETLLDAGIFKKFVRKYCPLPKKFLGKIKLGGF